MFNFKDRVEGVEKRADKFVEDEHFNADAIKKMQEEVSERYENLQVPLLKKKEKLEESLNGKQLFRDIQDELAWIQDKKPLVEATNTGTITPRLPSILKQNLINISRQRSDEYSQFTSEAHCTAS